MGKVKIKRKSTLIDMTAMSDVTVLLLTFFMLTSTFVKKEPVQVQTPSSVQEAPVPNANFATILVSPTGYVSIAVVGDGPDADIDFLKEKYRQENNGEEMPGYMVAEAKKEENRNAWTNEVMRSEIIKQAVADYNNLSKNDIALTEGEINNIVSYGVFSVPFKDLKKFAALPSSDQDKLFSKFYGMSAEEQEAYNKNPNNIQIGIPIDTEKGKKNEFQIWMQAIKKVAQDKYPVLNEGLVRGEGLIVKADKTTPYKTMHPVLDNMQTLKMTRFNLMTALKNKEQ